MTPDDAKALKTDAKLLLVCRLAEPWLRQSAHGHDPTINEPYETIVGDNYVQVVPEQLWVFNQKTGEVLRKLSESSIGGEQNQQLSLKLRRTPLLLEVSGGLRSQRYRIVIDDTPEESASLYGPAKTFGANRRIVFTLLVPENLTDVSFTLNGKPYTPNWTKDATRVGSYEAIRSATTVITVP